MAQISTSQHLNDTMKNRWLWGAFLSVGLLLQQNVAQAQEVDIHGFLSQGYLKSTGNNYLAQTKHGTWEFAEIGINFSSYVTDELRIGMQLFARDLGPVGNLALELDWAFGDFTLNDYLGIRMGRIKIPYGLYGETQDIDLVRATVLLPQAVYQADLRDILISFNGISLYGNIDLDDFGSFDYQVFGGAIIGNPAQGPDSSVARFLNDRGRTPLRYVDMAAFTVSDASDRWSAGASLQYNSFIDGLLFRGTVLHHRADFMAQFTNEFFGQIEQLGVAPNGFSRDLKLSTDDIYFSVLSLEYMWEDLIFAAEYALYYGTFRSNQPDIIPHSTLNTERWYAQLSYAVTDWSQVAIYYGTVNDSDDPYGTETQKETGEPHHFAFQKDLALCFRLDINDYWIVKLEGHLMDGTEQIYTTDNRKHPDRERYWTLLAAKTTLTF